MAFTFISSLRRALLAPLWLAGSLSGAPAWADAALAVPKPAAFSPDKLQRIDNFFDNEVATKKIPGAMVLIRQHGREVYFKQFGVSDTDTGRPMAADTIFPLHSMTKAITSFAAMMLVDQGRLKLDDPVSKYIPSFAKMKVGVEKKDDGGRAVLELVPTRRPLIIEDLLLHTSGITYGFYGNGLVKTAYANIYFGDFDNAQFAERIAMLPLAEQPRTLWDYGHSTDILGRIIEVASGQSLYQFEKTQFLDSLGMTTTKFFLTDPEERARFAKPLPRDRVVERNPLDVTRWESGGGGLVSAMGDFTRFAQMLLNGGELDGKRYLSPATFTAMTTDHIGPGSGVERDYFYFPGDGFGFGYGFGIRTDSGKAVPPPPGSIGEIKWDGASGTYFVIDPANDMFFILLENSPSERTRIQPALKRIIYDALEK
ncbi:serine hydrolase domain-containing protein [uncultured Bradyrhizobium sp.]|uniref:serine hydrolase domain-containing protein n=1 Tax=uncultured Bradyrhizobium sp. TaxID=199684 RepID=UPI0035CC0C79